MANMRLNRGLVGGIEAGGTKFVCAIGTGPNDIRAQTRFPTSGPEETLGQAIEFFRSYGEPVAGIGIGSFGPVDLDPASSTYGYVTSTPKPGWQQTDVRGPIQAALGVPVAFDTDVNVAALGEYIWGAGRGLQTFLYLTIGTGIGGGGMVEGNLLHGLVHPEVGHIRIPHNREADPFPGICPFHGDCWEGLACGPAMERRWGRRAEELPADHPAWRLEAHYLALALVNLICTVSPQRIILGGGVMHQPHLFPLVRHEVQALLNGYVRSPALLNMIDTFLVSPALQGRSGMLGAIALAQQIGGRT